MKFFKPVFTIILCLSLLVISCDDVTFTGPQGPQGPQGRDGEVGLDTWSISRGVSLEIDAEFFWTRGYYMIEVIGIHALFSPSESINNPTSDRIRYKSNFIINVERDSYDYNRMYFRIQNTEDMDSKPSRNVVFAFTTSQGQFSGGYTNSVQVRAYKKEEGGDIYGS